MASSQSPVKQMLANYLRANIDDILDLMDEEHAADEAGLNKIIDEMASGVGVDGGDSAIERLTKALETAVRIYGKDGVVLVPAEVARQLIQHHRTRPVDFFESPEGDWVECFVDGELVTRGHSFHLREAIQVMRLLSGTAVTVRRFETPFEDVAGPYEALLKASRPI